MTDNFEKREAKRIDHTSPLQVKDLRSDAIYEARMFNYSYGGIYFESDAYFEEGTLLYIGIRNSPYSPTAWVFEYLKGEVIWRTDLKRSLSKYGYGIELTSKSVEEKIEIDGKEKSKELRKHPRKLLSQTVQFRTANELCKGTTKNISASGAFIVTKEKLEPGECFKLNLFSRNGKITKIIGQVVWVNEEGFGMKFKKIIK